MKNGNSTSFFLENLKVANPNERIGVQFTMLPEKGLTCSCITNYQQFTVKKLVYCLFFLSNSLKTSNKSFSEISSAIPIPYSFNSQIDASLISIFG